MVIRASSAAQINLLIADLASPDPVTRDAAVARLTVIGGRAVERLCDAASNATGGARIAALRALEGIGSPRAFEAAAAALDVPDAAVAAVAVLRRLLQTTRETEAIDALTTAALDGGRPQAIRIAAAQALNDVGRGAVEPLWEQLAADPETKVRDWVRAHRGSRSRPKSAPAEPAGVEAFANGAQINDPAAVKRAVARDGATAPLTALRRLVEVIREREERAQARESPVWAAARATVHMALADRGSRLALYDVRETIERSNGPLAVEFLAVVTKIGDASCLEPLAAAYARSTRSGEDWWRQHVRQAFHAIVQRDRITRRHAAMKKVLARWPAITR